MVRMTLRHPTLSRPAVPASKTMRAGVDTAGPGRNELARPLSPSEARLVALQRLADNSAPQSPCSGGLGAAASGPIQGVFTGELKTRPYAEIAADLGVPTWKVERLAKGPQSFATVAELAAHLAPAAAEGKGKAPARPVPGGGAAKGNRKAPARPTPSTDVVRDKGKAPARPAPGGKTVNARGEAPERAATATEPGEPAAAAREVAPGVVHDAEGEARVQDAIVEQFNSAKPGGGMLMRALKSEDLEKILKALPASGTPLAKARRLEYRTNLFSYIRTDNNMKTFQGRRVGFLVDWKAVWSMVGAKDDGSPTIWDADQQSPATALDKARSYGEAGGTREGLGAALDGIARRQIAAKQAGEQNLPNWNEVLTYNATTAGLRGLLWIQPPAYAMKLDGVGDTYEKFFTPERKASLRALYEAKTGQEVMPIYRYEHLQNPRGQALTEAKGKLGAPGATTLTLVEEVRPGDG